MKKTCFMPCGSETPVGTNHSNKNVARVGHPDFWVVWRGLDERCYSAKIQGHGQFIRAGSALVAFEFGVADADLAEEFTGLTQTGLIGSALVVGVGKLHRVVLPPADLAEAKAARWLLFESQIAAAGAGKARRGGFWGRDAGSFERRI